MSVKHLYGPSGKYITVDDLDGLYLPASPLDSYKQFTDLQSLTARENDVIVCAYPKSGLHWIWEIVNMLIHRTTDITQSLMESRMLEMNLKETLERQKSPGILTSHLRYNQLPRSFREKKTKLVYILRDPRAVAVSYFHHLIQLKSNTNLTSNDWKEYLQMFLEGKVPFGSWFDSIKDWENEIRRQTDHPIYVIYYENFKKDPLAEVQRLAQFLGVELSTDLYVQIVKNTQLQNMKTAKERVKKNYIKNYFKKENYPFYRTGTVDDWKNQFTVRENEYFEEQYEKLMKGSTVRLKSLL